MTDDYYDELGVEPGRLTRRDPRCVPSSASPTSKRARDEEGRHRVAAAGEPRRGRAAATGVERAVRPVPAPALRRASSARIASRAATTSCVDDDDDDAQRAGAELAGGASCWRRRRRRTRRRHGGAATAAARPRRRPTAVHARAHGRAARGDDARRPRVRGMALLFDFAILLVIFFAVSLVVPGLHQERLPGQPDRISTRRPRRRRPRRDRRAEDVDSADDRRATRRRARADDSAAERRRGARRTPKRRRSAAGRTPKAATSRSQKHARQAVDEHQAHRATSRSSSCSCSRSLYLVPSTALTGQTLGNALRKIRVVRVDGSPVGLVAVARALRRARSCVALADPARSARSLGLGMVLVVAPRPRTVRASTTSSRETLVVDDAESRTVPHAPNADVGDESMPSTCTPSRRARRSRSSCSAARAPTSPR